MLLVRSLLGPISFHYSYIVLVICYGLLFLVIVWDVSLRVYARLILDSNSDKCLRERSRSFGSTISTTTPSLRMARQRQEPFVVDDNIFSGIKLWIIQCICIVCLSVIRVLQLTNLAITSNASSNNGWPRCVDQNLNYLASLAFSLVIVRLFWCFHKVLCYRSYRFKVRTRCNGAPFCWNQGRSLESGLLSIMIFASLLLQVIFSVRYFGCERSGTCQTWDYAATNSVHVVLLWLGPALLTLMLGNRVVQVMRRWIALTWPIQEENQLEYGISRRHITRTCHLVWFIGFCVSVRAVLVVTLQHVRNVSIPVQIFSTLVDSLVGEILVCLVVTIVTRIPETESNPVTETLFEPVYRGGRSRIMTGPTTMTRPNIYSVPTHLNNWRPTFPKLLPVFEVVTSNNENGKQRSDHKSNRNNNGHHNGRDSSLSSSSLSLSLSPNPMLTRHGNIMNHVTNK